MKPHYSILCILISLLFNACDYAIDRIEVPEKKDKAVDWRLNQINYLPKNHTSGGPPPYSHYFFYKMDTLVEAHWSNLGKTYYYYKNQLLTQRITTNWNGTDTVSIDSLFYFEQPSLLKKRIYWYRVSRSSKKLFQTIFTYQYDSEGNVIREAHEIPIEKWTRTREISWEEGNPTEIIIYNQAESAPSPTPVLIKRFTYDSGINYKFHEKWTPDAIRPKNNVITTYLANDIFQESYSQTIKYDRQGRPARLFGNLTITQNSMDTIELIYE